ncbi:MAG: DegT/DnrJ/EryC1/StrS family aminotransferase [Clostridia bacterium]|nr:DegT/DnrJ/EryC1/StrS family aminotransferase [Clostridia bacterium]MDD4375344.1 DegT/DnrJ/EryC1/StrS family aminotransferase [Clostridia bacterium]
MNISFSPPDISQKEIDNVVEVLKSGWITTGPKTKLFEKKISKYLGTERVVCLNSATACLECILRVLGVGPGDEVITTAYTYTASASVVDHIGAKLVLVDVKEESFEMDYDSLFNVITEKTKVIIPVDIAGIPCDYEKIFSIVEKNKGKFVPENEIQKLYNRVIVIADAAHSFGAEYKGNKIGNVADFTSFSFHAVKNLTTGEGGALTWKSIPELNNDELYKKVMLMSLHGQSKDALSKSKLGAWEYDIIDTAYKWNMTDIMAAIGLAQLERYDAMLERRKEIIEKYNNAFKNYNVCLQNHYVKEYSSSGHLYLLRINKIDETRRNEIIVYLAKKGIATNVHYKPLPMHTAYKGLGFNIDDYPKAYMQYRNEISLPLNTKLTDEEVEYIIKKVKECLN